MKSNTSPTQQQRTRELALFNIWRDRLPQDRQQLLAANAEKRRIEQDATTNQQPSRQGRSAERTDAR